MLKSHILIKRIPKEGPTYEMILNKANVIEVTPKGDMECWMKYWDGKEIRTCIVEGSVIVTFEKVFCA